MAGTEKMQVVQNYLTVWAPHLLQDERLVEELQSEAEEASKENVYDAVHTYFLAWCAVKASDLCTEGGATGLRYQKDSIIWMKISSSDRLANAEFGDIRSAQLRVSTWFSDRVDECLEIIRDHFGEEAEMAIDIFDEWLMKGLPEDNVSKRRILVKIVAILREEFGTSTGTPEIPPPPSPDHKTSELLAQMKKDAADARQSTRAASHAVLATMFRRKRPQPPQSRATTVCS